MNKNYEPLGKHLRLVDTRNVDMVTDRLLGINIDKYFMPSVANVIGTDLSRYKLISKGHFACNTMHVGRDERLPVALYTDDTPAIVSPAYAIFKIVDESRLLPDYLMMWFKRAEFDRVCWLKTDGSVRGGISWDDICRLELPVPPIEQQQKIIKAYQAITDRIALKRAINDNLEALAGAIFMDSFAESYHTTAKLGEIMTLNYGKSLTATTRVQGTIPVYSSAGITGWHNNPNIFEPSIIIGRKGTVGTLYYCPHPVFCIDTAYYVTQSDTSLPLLVAFRLLKSLNLPEYNEDAAVPGLNRNTVYAIEIAYPHTATLNKCNEQLASTYNALDSNNNEIARLQELSETLVSRLTVL